MTEQAKFLEGNLLAHITTMSLTASVGLMAIFAVDFVDMIFISMLGKAELAAAVGYAGAILFFTSSFGIGMAIASGVLVARALGSGDSIRAAQTATNTLIAGAAVGAAFSGVVWMYLEPIARLVGASGETLDLAVAYLQIIIPSLPLLLIGMVASAILRAHGAARLSMVATLVAGAVNAVLDPILIFGLGMELQGAAWASVAARVSMGVAALWPIITRYGGLHMPRPAALAADLSPIFALAFPAILTQMATPIGQAYITRAMSSYGEDAVSGMAIIGRITPIAFGVIFALSGAIGPIIGQNAGAGNMARVRGAIRDGMIFTGVVTVVVTIALFLLRQPIADLFSADGVTLALVFLFCGPLALAYFFNGVIFVTNAAFNNLGHPYYSTWINWGRHTLGTIPFVLVFSLWLGAPGVLIGQAIGGIAFAGIALLLTYRVLEAERKHAPASGFDRQARQLALVHARR